MKKRFWTILLILIFLPYFLIAFETLMPLRGVTKNESNVLFSRQTTMPFCDVTKPENNVLFSRQNLPQPISPSKGKRLEFLSTFVTQRLISVLFKSTAEAQSRIDFEQSQNVIATIDDKSIMADQFRKEMARRGGHIPGRFDDIEEKETLLDEILRFECLALMAIKEGYDKDPDIIETLKKLMVQKFWQDKKDSIFKDIHVTDEEINKYYETNIDDYTAPEMARVAVIYIKLPAKGSEESTNILEEKAKNVLKEAKKLSASELSFGHLAEEYSDDKATKYRGGDIGWVSKGAKIYKWEKSVIDTIFCLEEVGNIGPIIQTTRGLYLVKLMDKKVGTVSSLMQVKTGIRDKLIADKSRKAQEEYYQGIKKEFDIKINREMLKSVGKSIENSKNTEDPPTFPLNIKVR